MDDVKYLVQPWDALVGNSMLLPIEALATTGRRLVSKEHGSCALGVLTSRSTKESGSSAEMQKTAEARAIPASEVPTIIRSESRRFHEIGSSLRCIQYIVFP